LADGAVHVWKASLDLPPNRVRSLAQTLSEDERARARRFVFEQDRFRFIARRGLLRAILSRYLHTAPCALEVRYGPYGKPAISSGAGGSLPRFGVSHADGTALYAVTAGREVGVDLERIHSDFPSEDIAERFLSPGEVQALRAVNAARRPIAFLQLPDAKRSLSEGERRRSASCRWISSTYRLSRVNRRCFCGRPMIRKQPPVGYSEIPHRSWLCRRRARAIRSSAVLAVVRRVVPEMAAGICFRLPGLRSLTRRSLGH
jgi:hypothetical protein